MPAPRPYGVGPYGTDVYSRYSGAVYEVGAATGITFAAALRGVTRLRLAEAITQIVFLPRAMLAWSWAAWAPCADGAWTSSTPCEDGAWVPSQPCGEGSWTGTRLV